MTVQQVLADWRTAPIDPKLRATLQYLEKLTLTPDQVTREDARAVLEAGTSRDALEDAIAICAGFCTIDRVADAMRFHVGTDAAFRVGARALLSRGYAL